jgi:hypothetical protein
MNLVAITRVKNEIDIIEPFIRHHAYHFDKIIVVDDGSTDGTYEVLCALKAAGLPLLLLREPSIGYRQSQTMSRLLHLAVNHFSPDWIVPVDADEFIAPLQGATLTQVLTDCEPELLKIEWYNYVWRPEDDTASQPNPVLRMRMCMPASPEWLGKVIIPARLVVDGVELTQGNHALMWNGKPLVARPFGAVRLGHFPIRGISQYAGKIAIGYLQYVATPDWDRRIGFHYIEPFRLLVEGRGPFVAAMAEASRRYSLSDDAPAAGDPQENPLRYRGGPLSFSTEGKSGFTDVLRYAETLAEQISSLARRGATTPAHPASSGAPSSLTGGAVTTSVANSEAVAAQTFQSFWAGGPLTPYESFCLTSFIAHGHRFDLYTYDRSIVVPEGVRVCDASEVLAADAFFVYEDGFGKGSPAAFANVFRYKLLADKGGWWVDTDVVCRSDYIPAFTEFMAWEDAHVVNCAILHFSSGHPLMIHCMEETMRLGRQVRWGDTGPRLLTRMVEELGYSAQVLPSSICYPVHYMEALDLLRPSQVAALQARTKSAFFVHLWNAVLHHNEVQKHLRPPQGSLLREWVDQYPVPGWSGDYDVDAFERIVPRQF